MRFAAHDGFRKLQLGLLAAGLLVTSAGVASAAVYPVGYPNGLSLDGNIFWNNGAGVTLASQASGAPSAALINAVPTFAQPCPTGYNAATLITTTFTHNIYADPLLPSCTWPNGNPNFQPAVGSPAYTQAMEIPTGDPFLTQTCYIGAIGPNPGDDWTRGWTYYDSLGTGRDDLHLPTMTNPRPVALHDNIILLSDQTWAADSLHVIRGQFRVAGGANLTIQPGVVVIEERATLGTIRIERGSKLFAVGTKDSVIIVTTDDAPGAMRTGGCGGIVLNGFAKVNNANSCAGDSAASEGGAIGFYGGNDDHDNSGQLKYVRVEYAGKEISPNNELNTFTNNAVGDGTSEEFLQAHQGADDGWEAFGGAVRVKHLICTDGHDDGLDWQQGYRGRAQFVVVRGIADLAPSGTQFGDKGIEADNNDVAPFDQDIDAQACSGQSNPICYNFTLVGDRSRSGAPFPGSTAGVNLRRGTAGVLMNSISTNFKTVGLKVDDDVTWRYHCRALNQFTTAGPLFTPNVFCSASTSGVPVSQGQVLVSHGSPNPFRNQVTFNFSLPTPGRVVVEVYSATGRLVTRIENGEMSAGQHTVSWKIGAQTPSGVYFYKVLSNSGQSTGKIIHID